MHIAPEQGQILPKIKFLSKYKAFVTVIIYVKFHHDIPNSKGTTGQKPFMYIDKCHNSVINY